MRRSQALRSPRAEEALAKVGKMFKSRDPNDMRLSIAGTLSQSFKKHLAMFFGLGLVVGLSYYEQKLRGMPMPSQDGRSLVT